MSRMRWWLLPFLLLISATMAFAQFSSNIQGTVKDPSGSAIPGASVKLTNLDTGVSQSTASDASGAYHFSSLAPGSYRVAVTAHGFQAGQVGIVLQTAQTSAVPVTLQISGKEQTVQVSAALPELDTADSRIQTTISTKQLHALPLQGRNFLGLTALAPGVTGLGGTAGGSPGDAPDNFSTEHAVDASANGHNFEGNSYSVDGLDVTSNIRPGVLNLSPNPDSVQEVSIQTNTFKVDNGRASSIEVAVTTKSGTNAFHGSASDYFTDQHLWARSEFTGKYEPFKKNDLSGTIGGPIIRNHTFFFASIEPLRSTFSSGTQVHTFESPEFVQWAQANFPNSIGTKLLAGYPISGATVTGVAKTAQDVFGNSCGTAATSNIPCNLPMVDTGTYKPSPYRNGLQYNIRIDQYWKNDRLYGNFYRTSLDTQNPAIRTGLGTTNYNLTKSFQVNETHTFSANLLNEAMFGVDRVQGSNIVSGPFHLPQVGVVGQDTGVGLGWGPGTFIQHNYNWKDVVSLVRGAHTFQFGVEGWHGDDDAEFAGVHGRPSFSFNNLLDLVQDNPYDEGGVSFDPLTGKAAKGAYKYLASKEGAFVQDEWKARPNLTLTMGLRWDDYGNPYPASGTNLSNFYLASGSDLNTQVANGVMRQVSNVFQNRLDKNFSPRLGVAWDPSNHGTWVVRGGIGVYHDWPTLGIDENNLNGNPPGYVYPDFRAGSATPPVFSVGTQDTYPYGFTFPNIPPRTLDSHGGLTGLQLSVGGIDPNLKASTSYNYVAGLYHELSHGLVAGIAYSGSRSSNDLVGSQSSQNPGTDVNRFAGDLIVNKNQLQRLNPSFGSINYTFNGNRSLYNALILSLKGKLTSNGSFQASYTRSSAKDYGATYPDQHNLSQYWGPSDWNVPNRLSFSGSYELPSFQGSNALVHRVFGGWEISSTVILQSGTPFTVFTGAPFQPVLDSNGNVVGLQPGSGDYNADGYNFDFPNAPSGGYTQSTSRQDYLHGLFPASAFGTPALGKEGNEVRNQFQNPGYANFDAGFIKNNQITERIGLQLRFEFFNLFNRVNLQGVDGNLASGTFGQSTSTFNPRYLQMGVRLTF